MKYSEMLIKREKKVSPSLRRVWVEIHSFGGGSCCIGCHPPCGGCGLKYMEGGGAAAATGSPSLRRVWVEIDYCMYATGVVAVTLLAEGVG